MLPTTIEVLKAATRADPTLDPAARARVIAAMQAATTPTAATEAPGARILRRTEVAHRLSLSLRSIDKLAVQGVLQKIRFPGRGRAAGFRAADVDALIGTGRT